MAKTVALQALQDPTVLDVARKVGARFDGCGEDVAQQVALKLLTRAERYDSIPAGLVATIAHTTAIDAFRRDTTRAAVSLEVVPPSASTVITDLAEYRDLIGGLPPIYRILLFLHRVWRMTYAEVAVALALSHGTVKRWTQDAKRMLEAAPSWKSPALERFVVMRRDNKKCWYNVVSLDCESRECARRILTPLVPGAELVGSDLRTETL